MIERFGLLPAPIAPASGSGPAPSFGAWREPGFGGSVVRAVMILGLAGVIGCSHAINPAAIEDAQLGVRIKTALINDPELGARAVEVRVVSGVAHLSGRVRSEEEAERLIRLVRSVPGVRDVRSEVRAGPPPAAPAQTRGRPAAGEPMEAPDDPRLIALGGSMSWAAPRSGRLLGGTSFGPLVRFGSGSGLALAIELSWLSADLVDGSADDVPVGRLRVRPIMGGAGYTLRNDRVSAALALVGGYSFNSISVGELVPGRVLALRADNGLALRPGVSVWFDVSRRVAISLSAGYLIVRPTVTFLEDGRVTTRRMRGDTVLVSTGVAYKLF